MLRPSAHTASNWVSWLVGGCGCEFSEHGRRIASGVLLGNVEETAFFVGWHRHICDDDDNDDSDNERVHCMQTHIFIRVNIVFSCWLCCGLRHCVCCRMCYGWMMGVRTMDDGATYEYKHANYSGKRGSVREDIVGNRTATRIYLVKA